MQWYAKLNKLKKIMLRNFVLSTAAYHIALLISYLSIWLEISFYGYTYFNQLLAAVYISNGLILWVNLNKNRMTRVFSNYMLAVQMINGFILFSIWNFLMADLRVITLICVMMVLAFLYAYSTRFYSLLLILSVSVIHLASTYIGITYFDHPGNLVKEMMNILAFFFSAMLVATMLHRLSNLLRSQASNDHLTQLLNRRAMSKHIKDEYQRCKRFQLPVTLVMMDLDDFKIINDTFGHDGGDVVLIEVAETLRDELRVVDYIARWGGEEFLALLIGVDPDKGIAPIQRVLDRLKRSPVEFEGRSIPVSFSAGMVPLAKFESSDQAIREADRLLYIAKSEGKSKVLVPTMNSGING